MNLASLLLQRALKLPTPDTRDLVVRRDLRVPMSDGVELLADRWTPKAGGDGLPVALLRTPYGRAGLAGMSMARPLAERGFQVVIQSVRGTFGSGGEFDPFRHERADGLATLDWLLAQAWCGESIVLTGQSYLGYVQWAVADALPPQVKAILPQVTESALTLEFLRADGFSLETPYNWAVLVAGQERRWAIPRRFLNRERIRRAQAVLPLGQADRAAIGRRSEYFQDILAHDAASPHWAGCDHRARVADVTVPVSSLGGWFDIFLPGQLRDFAALQAAGATARLTVGPWSHLSLGMGPVAYGETFGFGLALARGEKPAERAPVRLYVMGARADWRDFPSWPPASHTPRRYHLHPAGALSPASPVESAPDAYRYDPADPTPAVGGVRMSPLAGPQDNTALEARADVLTYTTPPLAEDVEVIGEVSAEIWFASSRANADVFVRLCDVDGQGRSTNVCDGLTSLTSADELSQVRVTLWPTAYRFAAGHRIRVQVSSGAFPRYARNPGTGAPRATATTLRAADQRVHHSPATPSAIILPIGT